MLCDIAGQLFITVTHGCNMILSILAKLALAFAFFAILVAILGAIIAMLSLHVSLSDEAGKGKEEE